MFFSSPVLSWILSTEHFGAEPEGEVALQCLLHRRQEEGEATLEEEPGEQLRGESASEETSHVSQRALFPFTENIRSLFIACQRQTCSFMYSHTGPV